MKRVRKEQDNQHFKIMSANYLTNSFCCDYLQNKGFKESLNFLFYSIFFTVSKKV